MRYRVAGTVKGEDTWMDDPVIVQNQPLKECVTLWQRVAVWEAVETTRPRLQDQLASREL